MTTREEQKEQRRQKILYTALELFVKKGYTETKIQDIAKAVDMSTGLMFHYFESKEQVLETLVEMGVAGTNEPQGMEFSTPLEFFEGFLEQLFEYAKNEKWVLYMFVLMTQARSSAGIPEHIREKAMKVNQIELSAKVIEQGQSLGYFRKGNSYALSFAFWSSVQGIMEQLALNDEVKEDVFPEIEWIIDIIRER